MIGTPNTNPVLVTQLGWLRECPGQAFLRMAAAAPVPDIAPRLAPPTPEQRDARLAMMQAVRDAAEAQP